MTKYNELCQKTQNNRKQFKDYEEQCRQLIVDFRSAIINYLECTEDRVIWEPFSPDEPEESREVKGVIQVSLDQKMSLYNDAYYGFIFRILLYDPNKVIVGGNYLILPMIVKKDGTKFTVKLGKELKKYEINELTSFAEYLVSKIEEYLDNEFHNFLQGGEKQPWGFISAQE